MPIHACQKCAAIVSQSASVRRSLAMEATEEVLQEAQSNYEALGKDGNRLRWHRYSKKKSNMARLGFGVKLIVAFIFSKSCSADIALRYVAMHCAAKKSRGVGNTFAEDDVDDWLATASHDRSFQQAEQNRDHYIAFTAFKFLAEEAAYTWLLSQNAKGIPVLSQDLLAYYKDSVPQHAIGAKMRKHFESLTKQKKKEKWLNRFRNKWDASYRKMINREHRPQEILKQQVRRQKNEQKGNEAIFGSETEFIFGFETESFFGSKLNSKPSAFFSKHGFDALVEKAVS